MRGQIVVSKGFPSSGELSRAAARGDGRPESWSEGGRTHEALQVPALGESGGGGGSSGPWRLLPPLSLPALEPRGALAPTPW